MINVLNGYVSQGPGADRLAYVPNPTTPAVGPLPNIIWQDTDGDGAQYWWDIANAVWVESIPGTIGTVTNVSGVNANGFTVGVADPSTTPAVTVGVSITGILVGNGTAIAAAVAGDFPTLNQNTTGSAATLTTPRNINGVAFNGSADITVTAAAGTLSGTTLAATVVTSSLTALGTIATGVWQGTAVGAIYGGTGITSYTTGDLLYASATNVLSKLAVGTDTHVLTLTGGVPVWAAPAGGGGTPGGSTTQLQYNNAGAFGGIAGATFSAGVLTLPNLTVSNSSGSTDLAISAISAQASILSFRGVSSTVSYMGSAGAAGQIIGDSSVNDFNLFNNGFRFRFCTATGAGATGFSLEGANAGISWAGSTSSTVPVKSSLTVFPASGNCALALQAASASPVFISFKANNDGYAAVSVGQSVSTNQFLSGSAAGDLCVTINGSGQRFLVGTASGGGNPIGFGVATANGGIFTSAPAGGTSANWKLGIAASVSPTAPNRTVQLDVGGTLLYLHAKTTND